MCKRKGDLYSRIFFSHRMEEPAETLRIVSIYHRIWLNKVITHSTFLDSVHSLHYYVHTLNEPPINPYRSVFAFLLLFLYIFPQVRISVAKLD